MIGHSVLLLEFKLCYFKNLKSFSIRVKNEKWVGAHNSVKKKQTNKQQTKTKTKQTNKKNIGFLFDLWVRLGDFSVNYAGKLKLGI